MKLFGGSKARIECEVIAKACMECEVVAKNIVPEQNPKRPQNIKWTIPKKEI